MSVLRYRLMRSLREDNVDLPYDRMMLQSLTPQQSESKSSIGSEYLVKEQGCPKRVQLELDQGEDGGTGGLEEEELGPQPGGKSLIADTNLCIQWGRARGPDISLSTYGGIGGGGKGVSSATTSKTAHGLIKTTSEEPGPQGAETRFCQGLIDLERVKLMGAQSLASSNAYFQAAVRQAESWKRASDKADNALRKQQRKYASLERKLKREEEDLGESNAELVVLRAEKDRAIDNYLDSEEFTHSMRASPDINPADYVCPDDEALLQRFRTRVVVSDRTPQDPLLPPPESSSRPSVDDHSSSSSGTTETSSESGADDDMDAEGSSGP
ncbi:hypothetical protein AgCh_035409 [Apium graveolens]